MKEEDEIFDLFEELSSARENQRDRKHQEDLRAKEVKPVEIVDMGEECVGG